MTDRDHTYQIAVCETRGIFSKSIQRVTGGRYTHSYLIDGDGTWSMEPGGLIYRPFDYWGDANPTSGFEATAVQQHLIDQFVENHQHTPYDWFGDLIVGLDDLTPDWMNPFWHEIEHLEDKVSPGMFCSAFTDAVMTAAGFHLFTDRRPSHAVTPMDLYREFRDRGWTK